MQADNPSLILQTLDARLDHAVELTLIGKSALWLGFGNVPVAYSVTQDVDTVVPAQQSEQMNDDLAFWDALTAANAELQPLGIYLTHIFEEWQIIMRREWLIHRVPIQRPALTHLRLFRPATLDLILSKMMRGDDPQHMDEISWMIGLENISTLDLETAFSSAHVPEDEEVAQAFEIAKPCVLAMTKRV
ncbi:MAG: hypothetical protein B7Z47_00785 [Chthoniobacter sp. 12-60-6]|nr:MAG: hypothetical protein B7Z47_00785 [Chthoniobacter sp. 12-60-6]